MKIKKLWTLLLALVFTVCLISPAVTTEVYASSGVAMTVNSTEYEDHATGWSAAVKLASGDKVMLWYNSSAPVPVCEALTLN